jgi:hypothetical protein
MPKSHFPPIPGTLRQVIPIAQSQVHGDVRVTAVALEVYEPRGMVLSLLVQIEPDALDASERFGGVRVAATLRDNLGTSYWLAERPGEGASERQSHRVLLPNFGERLSDEAHRLDIQIAELHWERYEETPDSREQRIPLEATIGPWQFTALIEDAKPVNEIA